MLQTPISVDLWIDLNDPVSYLTLVALRKALAGHAQEEYFRTFIHPFFADRAASQNPITLGDLLGVQPNQVITKRSKSVQQMAKNLGVRLNYDAILAPTTDLAQRLVAYAGQVDEEDGTVFGSAPLQLRIAEALMRTQVEVAADLTDRSVLIGVGQDFGVPAETVLEALESEFLGKTVTEGHQLALHLGVEETPILLFDEQFLADGLLHPGRYRNVLDAVVLARGYTGNGKGDACEEISHGAREETDPETDKGADTKGKS